MVYYSPLTRNHPARGVSLAMPQRDVIFLASELENQDIVVTCVGEWMAVDTSNAPPPIRRNLPVSGPFCSPRILPARPLNPIPCPVVRDTGVVRPPLDAVLRLGTYSQASPQAINGHLPTIVSPSHCQWKRGCSRYNGGTHPPSGGALQHVSSSSLLLRIPNRAIQPSRAETKHKCGGEPKEQQKPG